MSKSTPAQAGAAPAARRGPSSGYAVLSTVDDDAEYERAAGEPYGGTSPEERASTCSFLFFLWLTPVLKRGVAKKRLDEADMYPLCSTEKSVNVAARFQRAWDATAGMTSGGNRMVAACWQLFRGSFFAALGLKVASDLMRFVGPVALQQLLAWLGDIDAPAPWWCPAAVATEHRGYYYSGVMVVAMFFQSLLNVHSFVVAFRMGVVARSTIIVAVYDKALRQAVHARGGTPTGKIVNLMSSDAGRMQWALPFMHWMPAGLLQIAIAVSMLWQLLGSSLLVGIITCAVLSPVTATVTTRFHKFNSVVLAKRDIRVGKVNELLAAMKLCKSCAWERGFADRVDDERELELGSLFKYQVAVMLSGVMWECVPVIIAVVSFAAFAALGGELTAEVAFTALSLFDILVEPCTSFGWVVADVIMANTGFQRVGRYLDSPDLQSQSVHRLPAARSGMAVRVSDSCFTWGSSEVSMQLDDDDKNCALHKEWSELSKKQKKAAKSLACDAAAWSILREAKGYGQPAAKPFRLENINFEIPVGSTWAVVGSVGAGKSSLLHALLGEMEREMEPASVVELHGSTAFASQSAFIVNATIKENILFGCEYDATRYDSTIEACCLRPDLALFAAGDRTEVGEQGITLSGGQRQRLSLARAVYSDADVYLLDDVLSAVDAHVGADLMTKVINGLLRDKTIVMATHAVHLLDRFDSVLHLKEGKVVEAGPYSQLVESGGELAQLVSGRADSPSAAHSNKTSAAESGNADEEVTVTAVQQGTSTDTLSDKKASADGTLMTEETRDEGGVNRKVYIEYARAAGFTHVVMVIASFGAYPAIQAGTALWLVAWSEDRLGWSQMSYNLVYAGVAVGSILLMVVRQILRAYVSVRASRTLHKRMLDSLVRTSMSFFETTPHGRVINRFSNDMTTIDEQLSNSLGEACQCFFNILVTVFAVSLSSPWFVVVLPAIGYVYFTMQKYFVIASRELKRLDNVSKSPIYAHFSETLSGITTIRAFGATERFVDASNEALDKNVQASYLMNCGINRWLMFWTTGAVGTASIGAAAFIAAATGRASPGLAAMAIKYSMQVSWALIWLVRAFTDTETQAVSVERVIEYAKLQPEEEPTTLQLTPSISWPHAGKVTWTGVSLRYRPSLDPALKNISLSIEAGEKVGVCGRTGAGKSSFTVAMLRLADCIDGTITIDGVDTARITRERLRSSIALIPQDATMFAGKIRLNLDPLGQHTDTELLGALGSVHLSDMVASAGGLDGMVAEEGNNWSQGQRQLLCIARALLRSAQVVMLDEATASCDMETDDMVQRLIRSVFKHCTVITVAHRIATIADSDRILVLSRGEIAEYDTPSVLEARKGSIYRSLLESSEYK